MTIAAAGTARRKTRAATALISGVTTTKGTTATTTTKTQTVATVTGTAATTDAAAAARIVEPSPPSGLFLKMAATMTGAETELTASFVLRAKNVLMFLVYCFVCPVTSSKSGRLTVYLKKYFFEDVVFEGEKNIANASSVSSSISPN